MSEQNINEQDVAKLNQPLRSRVDAVEAANQRAIAKAEEERDRALLGLREYLEQRIEARCGALGNEIAANKELLGGKIDALGELTAQYQEQQRYALEVASAEREKSASTLREQYEKAQKQADAEREKSASALREALTRQINTGDENLRQHIDHQREQVDAAFEASKEAISKAEAATEKRFGTVDEIWTQIRDARSQFIPRELYEQDRVDARRRGDAMLELIQAQSVRLTEIEARGGGEKDHAAEIRSTLAIGVAIIAVVVSTAIGLIAMFAA